MNTPPQEHPKKKTRFVYEYEGRNIICPLNHENVRLGVRELIDHLKAGHRELENIPSYDIDLSIKTSPNVQYSLQHNANISDFDFDPTDRFVLRKVHVPQKQDVLPPSPPPPPTMDIQQKQDGQQAQPVVLEEEKKKDVPPNTPVQAEGEEEGGRPGGSRRTIPSSTSRLRIETHTFTVNPLIGSVYDPIVRSMNGILPEKVPAMTYADIPVPPLIAAFIMCWTYNTHHYSDDGWMVVFESGPMRPERIQLRANYLLVGYLALRKSTGNEVKWATRLYVDVYDPEMKGFYYFDNKNKFQVAHTILTLNKFKKNVEVRSRRKMNK